MIKLENKEVFGFEHAIRGMRNPLNSWDKSDSGIDCTMDTQDKCYNDKEWLLCEDCNNFKIGKNDLKLMKNLCNAGTDHRKFMRMITVYMDITAPLYWWKEADTYKVGTVANSCSTMHKIHEKEFTRDDFSCEHLLSDKNLGTLSYYLCDTITPKNLMGLTIQMLNDCRETYLSTKQKEYWWQMIQLLPSSYNQKRTVMLNYEVLANMYHSRKAHKLDEWRQFCKEIEKLPYFKEVFIGEKFND